ncbi:chitin deacetylase [Blyttiomyces sp. JEL0837]|nr:chitin deacetylase [Blyttiomyces sp. JEL0837]
MIGIYLLAAASAAVLASAAASKPQRLEPRGYDFSGYPDQWTVPPENQEWTDFYLKNANIPDIPVRDSPNDNVNYDDPRVVTKCTGSNMFAQTFDDGPSEYTSDLLNTLRDNGAKATFFALGTMVISSPDALAQEKQDVTGVAPVCFRPPYGDFDERVLAIMDAMGLTVVWINYDSLDWAQSNGMGSVDTITGTVSGWVQQDTPNGILELEHDMYKYEVEAGKQISSNVIKGSRFSAVTVEECTGRGGLGDGFRFPPNFQL